MNRTKTPTPDFLPYGRQLVDEDDIAAVNEVLRSDWLTAGPATEAFEKALTEATGARYAIACSNGTAALHLISAALGLTQNDLAVVPAITFLATANAPRLAGADIAFSDVDAATGLITAQAFSEVLKTNSPDRIRVVFAVHLNGQTADLEELAAVAGEHGIAIIEDGSHALGSTYRTADGEQHRVGDCRFSMATVFSFHPVKTVAMGEGGAVTTNDAEFAERVRQLRNHGMVRDAESFMHPDQGMDRNGSPNPWYYEMQSLGFNYRPSDIHCALGLSQLRKLPAFSERRRRLMHLYDTALVELAPAVRPVTRVDWCDPVLHLYPVFIDFESAGVDRAAVMESLREEGIGTQVHYIPVNRQPYYRKLYGDSVLPGADRYYERVLSLPFFPAMADADVERVVTALKKVLNR